MMLDVAICDVAMLRCCDVASLRLASLVVASCDRSDEPVMSESPR